MSVLKNSNTVIGQVFLPNGAYQYKTKNGKQIYLNQYKEEFYIVYPNPSGSGTIVETYYGQCDC